eukprot:Sspe_Gene.54257::Locus_29952_Transcript_1_1_Confidence_1.000_Length_4890::g.54257::m.54257/K18443/GBF1; golgi-specific brefeldin A-resistance guanine nucleotide exchange factor 1
MEASEPNDHSRHMTPIDPAPFPHVTTPESPPKDWFKDRTIILSQLQNLILALRTNSLFCSRQRFLEVGKEGSHKLMAMAKQLRRELLSQESPLPSQRILQPFIEVARSEETTGPITGVALSAFTVFMDLNLTFVDVNTICDIASAALGVRSEVADVQSHEAVLARILQVLRACICHPLGVHLPEDHVLRILRGCFAIAMNGSPSELLRHTADSTTTDMVSHIYQRVRAKQSPHCFKEIFEFIVSLIATEHDTLPSLLGGVGEVISHEHIDSSGMCFKTQVAATKYAGLSLAYNILASLGDAIVEERCRPLLGVVQDSLCRALLRVSATVENVVVVSQMLRTLQLAAMSCGDHIAPQLLAFMLGTYLKMEEIPKNEGAGILSAYEVLERREVVLESLVELCSIPSFPVFLFRAYDLNLLAPNIFEQLCQFLSTQCFPQTEAKSQKLSTLNLLAANCLVELLKGIAARTLSAKQPSPVLAEHSALLEQKKLVQHVVQIFAEKPKKAVAFIRNLPVGPDGKNDFGIRPDCGGWDIGAMLYRYHTVLCKRKLGEYLSQGGDETIPVEQQEMTEGSPAYCLQIRKGFYSQFKFKGMMLTDAMRLVLSTFLLPGEAQCIDRLMEELATQWWHSNPHGESPESINPFLSVDASFIFAFSVIMLNTDLHSPSIEEKMSFEAFKRNNRKTNDGTDVPSEYQKWVYDSIKNHKIEMRDTLSDIAADDYIWHLAVDQSQREGGSIPGIGAVAPHDLDALIFSVLSGPCVSALAAVTEAVDSDRKADGVSPDKHTAGGEAIILMAMGGLYQCAAVASFHKMTDVLDNLVINLCKFTDVLQPRNGPGAVAQLGRSVKGLLACKEIFNIVRDLGNGIRHAWTEILSLVLRMYLLGCLPEQQHSREQGTPPSVLQKIQATQHYHDASTRTHSLQEPIRNNMYQEVTKEHRSRSSDLASYYEDSVSPILTRPLHKADKHHDDEDKPSSSWFGILGSGDEARRSQAAQSRVAVTRVCNVVRECKVSELLLEGVKGFDDEVLLCIVTALIRISGVEIPEKGTGDETLPLALAKPSDVHTTVFAVHLLADLLVSNGHRYHVAARFIESYFSRLLITAADVISGVQKGTAKGKQESSYWITVGEHVVVCRLRIFVRLAMNAELTHLQPTLLQTLATFDSLERSVYGPLVAKHVASSFRIVLTSSTLDGVKDAASWDLIIKLTEKSGLLARHNGATEACFSVLHHLATEEKFVWPDNVPHLVQALTLLFLLLAVGPGDSDWEHVARPDTLRVCNDPEPASPTTPKVVDALWSLQERLVGFAPSLLKSPSAKWTAGWLSVLRGFSDIVAAPTAAEGGKGPPPSEDGLVLSRERSDALLALQRSVLAPQLTVLPPAVCYEALAKVLIPLVERLCDYPAQERPEAVAASGFFGRFSPTAAINAVFGAALADSPPHGPSPAPKPPVLSKQGLHNLEDFQTRVLALLCKAFLHFLSSLASTPAEFQRLWIQLIGLLYAFYSRPQSNTSLTEGHGDEMQVAVREHIKIIIYVVASMQSSPLSTIPDFWPLTRELIACFTDVADGLNAHLDSLGLPPRKENFVIPSSFAFRGTAPASTSLPQQQQQQQQQP